MSHGLTQKTGSTQISDEELAAQMEREREELERTWAHEKGWRRLLMETDHKLIAKRYIVTAFVFFLFGGIEPALMRIQLSRPDNHFLGPAKDNQIFTVHGPTVLF